MEVKLTLCIVVVSVMFGGCVSEYCSETTGFCPYGCCGIFPHDCCSRSVATGTGTIVADWVIALVVIGLILAASTILAIICCVRRSRGTSGTVINSQGMTMMTTANTVYATNVHQQPSVWQDLQNCIRYQQQPAPSPQQLITSNVQHHYCQTGQTPLQTEGYAHLAYYPVNDTQLEATAPPAYDDIAHGEPLKYNDRDSPVIQVSNINANFQ